MLRLLFSATSKSVRLIDARCIRKRQLVVRPFVTLKYQTTEAVENDGASVGVAAMLLMAGSFSAAISQCDDAPPPANNESYSVDTQPKENPLWPHGVPGEMVNRYVDDILSNPDINISAIPDSVERLIYVSTVRLTLNAVYETLSMLHGHEILGHRLELEKVGSGKVLNLKHSSGKIDSRELDELADRLLSNKAVNQRWLPDLVERQVYSNCLRLVFSLLDNLADTLSIRLCGHELSLSFEPLTPQNAAQIAEQTEEQMVIDQDILEVLVSETIEESEEANESNSVLSYLPFYQSFVRDLHKTLYSLILGILSDMLSKTELAVLEERVQIRLVPMDIKTWRPTKDDDTISLQEKIEQLENELEQAQDAESRARTMAAIGIFTAAITTTIATILHLF